jgi:hypothetical protein
MKAQLLIWIQFFKAPHGQKWLLIGLIVFSGVLALLWDHSDKPTATVKREASPTVDTFIPAGYVLVPIQVVNYEALDSILGQFGIVDLFLPAPDLKKHAQKVASRIKILRAPQNPSQFAVLARTEDSEKLLSKGANFLVVIQNTKEPGTGFVIHSSDTSGISRRVQKSRLIVETTDD